MRCLHLCALAICFGPALGDFTSSGGTSRLYATRNASAAINGTGDGRWLNSTTSASVPRNITTGTAPTLLLSTAGSEADEPTTSSTLAGTAPSKFGIATASAQPQTAKSTVASLHATAASFADGHKSTVSRGSSSASSSQLGSSSSGGTSIQSHTGSVSTLSANITAGQWLNTSSPTTSPHSPISTVSALATNSTKAQWLNTSNITSAPVGSTPAPITNSTVEHWSNLSAATLISSTTTSIQQGNATVVLTNSTVSHWLNTSIITGSPANANPTSAIANSTILLWHNTTSFVSAPTLAANATLNATAIPANSTAPPRWQNVTSTPSVPVTTATATATATNTTACGQAAANGSFALQVSQPGGMFDTWWVRVVADGLLFTAARASASTFGIAGGSDAGGALCAVGYLDAQGLPLVAAVGALDATSAVWLLQRETVAALGTDYAAINCSVSSAAPGDTLSCGANATSHWLGCGLQLDLSSDAAATVGAGGLNCSSVALELVYVS